MDRRGATAVFAAFVSFALHGAVAFFALASRVERVDPRPSEDVRIELVVRDVVRPDPTLEAATGTERGTPVPRERVIRRRARVAVTDEGGTVVVAEPNHEAHDAVGVIEDGPSEVVPHAELDLSLRALPRAVAPPPVRAEATPEADVTIRPRAGGRHEVESSRLRAEIAPDGSMTFRQRLDDTPSNQQQLDRPDGVAPPPPLQLRAGGRFTVDLTEALMHNLGDDPRAGDKRAIYDRTRALRWDLIDQACHENGQRALLEVRGRLEAIWADGTLAEAERRALLFEIWDGCAESGEAARLGAQVRAIAIEFIREKIPRGSPFAYGAEELVALNARRVSAEPFAPYAWLDGGTRVEPSRTLWE